MARLLGPDVSSRLITQVVGSTVHEFSGWLTTIYSDDAGTVPADIAEYNQAAPATPGATITSSQVRLDATSRLPRFWFPSDGTDVLYARVVGGPLVEIRADEDRRLDAMTTVWSTGYLFEAPTGATSRVVLRAPIAATVTAVRGYRTGGTGAAINAQVNTSDLLAVDLSLSSAATWLAGPSVQNSTVAAGDSITVAVRSVTGTPTYVVVEVDLGAA